MLLLLSAGTEPTAKCNLFLALRMMETADNVTWKYEDCWDGTKQPTIYVWNIKIKYFLLGILKPNSQFPKKVSGVTVLGF